jgi:hypothetical protein
MSVECRSESEVPYILEVFKKESSWYGVLKIFGTRYFMCFYVAAKLFESSRICITGIYVLHTVLATCQIINQSLKIFLRFPFDTYLFYTVRFGIQAPDKGKSKILKIVMKKRPK